MEKIEDCGVKNVMRRAVGKVLGATQGGGMLGASTLTGDNNGDFKGIALSENIWDVDCVQERKSNTDDVIVNQICSEARVYIERPDYHIVIRGDEITFVRFLVSFNYSSDPFYRLLIMTGSSTKILESRTRAIVNSLDEGVSIIRGLTKEQAEGAIKANSRANEDMGALYRYLKENNISF